jgi:hypothetical protein
MWGLEAFAFELTSNTLTLEGGSAGRQFFERDDASRHRFRTSGVTATDGGEPSAEHLPVVGLERWLSQDPTQTRLNGFHAITDHTDILTVGGRATSVGPQPAHSWPT